MVNDILKAAGIQGKRGRYPTPPAGNYATYLDDITAGGPDHAPGVFRHDITLELYEPKLDDAAEAELEAAIGAAGLHWVKSDRTWIPSEQVYMVIYDFTYYEKRRT